jgi:tRNA A37 threonylcarbamoyladenosine biosynthesis protein TsaE
METNCTIFHSDIVRARFVNHVSSLEANSFLPGQGILHILWSQKFVYSVHKSLPFVAALIPDPDEE